LTVETPRGTHDRAAYMFRQLVRTGARCDRGA
jgi:hypothetical protein